MSKGVPFEESFAFVVPGVYALQLDPPTDSEQRGNLVSIWFYTLVNL